MILPPFVGRTNTYIRDLDCVCSGMEMREDENPELSAPEPRVLRPASIIVGTIQVSKYYLLP